jgi:hypothetical protein
MDRLSHPPGGDAADAREADDHGQLDQYVRE